MKAAVTLLLLLSAAPAPIALKVGAGTGVIHATVTIVPNSNNRWAVVQIEQADEYFRSSLIQLDGDKAAKVHNVWFYHLPPGCYEVTAVVYRVGQKHSEAGRASANVIVSGFTPEDVPRGCGSGQQ